ncbi:hypothetical protein SteCoe_11618 [Stentor coeruleus]|uniref:SANT domain-containing protein n=1 Tax=Stentor coeruleus TaxID=5963 RepID=A0A1R2CCQ4_9CILI|nr:hypothetical protein SteCoe_11618 [Stentor coeruleus]
MGPRWSEQELHLLFNGLRKHGRNWLLISEDFKQLKSSSIYPRTDSMIEAVYLKNKTYLNIPSANPTDFAAIMADHYDSSEGIKYELQDDDLKKYSPSEDPLGLPKKRQDRPYDLKTTSKKLYQKKCDCYEYTSKLADPSYIHSKKLIEGYSRKSFDNFVYARSTYLNDYALNKTEESPISPKFLQWCKAEWFYSYIDKGFFEYNEFEEALKVLKVNEIEVFTKYEFQVIRNALGRPKRFSANFIAQERKKLTKCREAMKVLQQGKVLPLAYHDMLIYIKINQSNPSSRLMVGQKVLAVHPSTRELRSGSILTLDSSRYHIQFDRPELGVAPVTDSQILPLITESLKPCEIEEPATFVYKPVQEREVISSSFVIEGFKAGVNIYAMAFLLKLLERKEALIELLKQYNAEFAENMNKHSTWRPDYDLQQQYAWICVAIQAINTSISKVLEIFRLRNRPPPQQVVTIEQDNKIEQIRDAAMSILMDQELEQRPSQFSENEHLRIQEFLKNGVVLIGVMDLMIKDNDYSLVKHLDENLTLLSPACESNKVKFEEVCRLVDQIKNKITNR